MFPRESTSQPQLRFETLRFGNRVDWDKDWDAQEVQCNRFQLFCNHHGLRVSGHGIELDYAIPRRPGAREE